MSCLTHRRNALVVKAYVVGLHFLVKKWSNVDTARSAIALAAHQIARVYGPSRQRNARQDDRHPTPGIIDRVTRVVGQSLVLQACVLFCSCGFTFSPVLVAIEEQVDSGVGSHSRVPNSFSTRSYTYLFGVLQ